MINAMLVQFFTRCLVLVALIFGTLSSNVKAEDSPLRCALLPQIFNLYLKIHYVHRQMNETLQKQTVDQWVLSLDPSRTLLYQSEIDKIKADLPKVFKSMPAGDCSAITEVQKLLIVRATENENIVRELLNDKYQLDESVELITDPDKRPYAKDLAEKKKLLLKMVNFQISNQLISKMKIPEAKKEVLHSYELAIKRQKDKKEWDAYVDFAESFARALDPHTGYLSRDSLEEFQIQMQLSLEGIGATLSSQNGFTIIEELVPGGAADRTKLLQPKDKIVAVAQDGEKTKNVIDQELPEVVRQIRGKKGTKVTLTVLRQGDQTKTFDVTIVRDKIDIKEQAAKITYEEKKAGDKTYKVGIIDLPSFYGGGKEGRNCYKDMKELVIQARKNKADALVLDLSRNGGGLLEDAVRIAGLFIRRGAIVATKGYDNQVDILEDTDGETQWTGPLGVLISRSSASASEILAGALKDYSRAIIIGSDHTFGKGTVQIVTPLALGLGALRVSTGMFFIPGGHSTQHQGVPADIEVPAPFAFDEVGEKNLDYSLPPQKVDAFLSDSVNSAKDSQSHWNPIQPNIVEALKKKSTDRVSKDPKFAEIRKNLEEAKKNQGVIRLSEIRKKSIEENKKEEKEKRKNARAKVKDALVPFVGEGVQIMLDYLEIQNTPPATQAKVTK